MKSSNKGKSQQTNTQPVKKHVPTTEQIAANQLLRILLSDAQQYSMKYGIAAPTGRGKTFTAMEYSNSDKRNVAHIFCNELTTAKAIKTAFSKRRELYILDDAHKLSDTALKAVAGYKGESGLIIMGTSALSARIKEGLSNNVVACTAIYNSIGKKFVTI